MNRYYKVLMGIVLIGVLSGVQSPVYAEKAAEKKCKAERILYGLSFSPYVRKARIILVEKKISYTFKRMIPSIGIKAQGKEVPKEFEDASPLGKIPAYREGNFTLADSAVIGDYLERSYPTDLYPKDTQEYGKAKWIESYSDTVVGAVTATIVKESIFKPKILNIPTDEKALEKAKTVGTEKVFQYLESRLSDQRPWFLTNFSIADAAVGSQLMTLEMVGVRVDQNLYPKLHTFLMKFKENPNVIKTFDTEEDLAYLPK